MRIYIIGFMGSGKSKFGKRLANKLKFDFQDLDTLIEEQTNRSIEDIFLNSGEDYFRKIERKVLKKTFRANNCVIATGGGTPAFFDNMIWINRNGFSIFLKLNSVALSTRLINSKTKRPLLRDVEEKDYKEAINELNKKRLKYYRLADLTISPIHLSPGQIMKYLPF